MQNRIHKSIVSIMFALAALGLGRISSASAADAPAAPYVLRGDLSEIKSQGFIRFLVHGEADYLPRQGDPRVAERALAEEFAIRLGLKPIFVSVEEQDDLISELNEGHGDVIVGSFGSQATGASKSLSAGPSDLSINLSSSESRTPRFNNSQILPARKLRCAKAVPTRKP